MAVPKSKRSYSKCKARRSSLTQNLIHSKLTKKLFFINKSNYFFNFSTIHFNTKLYNINIIKFKNIEKKLKKIN